MQDFEGDESPKQRDPKVISTESTTQVKEQNVVEPVCKGVSDEQQEKIRGQRGILRALAGICQFHKSYL